MTDVTPKSADAVANGSVSRSQPIPLRNQHESIRLRYKDAAKYLIWPSCIPPPTEVKRGFFTLGHPRKTRTLQEQMSYSRYGNSPVLLSQSTSALPTNRRAAGGLLHKFSFRRKPSASASTPDVSESKIVSVG